MSRHINTFHLKSGMAPQMDVPMNITEASRIEARRPNRSASMPHRYEPNAVPASATRGNHAAARAASEYSLRTPGMTNPNVAGFMMSMISATTSNPPNAQWARPSRPCGRGANCDGPPLDGAGARGSKPKAVAAIPATINSIPQSMPASIGMPASTYPRSRPIRNIGRWSTTPATTPTQPSQNASGLPSRTEWNDPGRRTDPFMVASPRTSSRTLPRRNPCVAVSPACQSPPRPSADGQAERATSPSTAWAAA